MTVIGLLICNILSVFLPNTQPFLNGVPERTVAITIDDLPTASLLNSPEQKKEITRKIIAALKSHDVPAIGFVNEGKLFKDDTPDSSNIELLQLWLDADLELGNHTFSHFSNHKTDTLQYFNDIKDGQVITNKLLAAKGEKVRYFRHPYLHTGNTLAKKDATEAFLESIQLTIAPVTVDNSDWLFSRAYDRVIIKGDSSLMQEIGIAYLKYMDDYFAYYEKQSEDIFGYEIKQILLLHANSINADYLDDLLILLKKRGYHFISLEEALEDKAYETPDTFTGDAGISWLHRWALTMGKKGDFFKGEPKTPDLITETAALED